MKRFSYAPGTSFAVARDDQNRNARDRIANLTQEQQDHLDALKLQAQFDAEARGEALNQEEIDRLAAIELDKILNSNHEAEITDQERADMELALKLEREESESARPRQQTLPENAELYDNPIDLFNQISKDLIDPNKEYQEISKDEKIFCLDIARDQIENGLSAIKGRDTEFFLNLITQLKQQLGNQNASSSPRASSNQGVLDENSRFK